MNRFISPWLLGALSVGAFIGISACGPQNLNDPDYLAQQGKDDLSVQGAEDDSLAAAAPAPASYTATRPHRIHRLPSEFVRETPIVTNSQEDRHTIQEVHHHKNIHHIQPSVNYHLINKVLHLKHKHFTHRHYHPHHVNKVSCRNQVVEDNEVMPESQVNNNTVVAPTDYSGCVAPSCSSIAPAYHPYYYPRHLAWLGHGRWGRGALFDSHFARYHGWRR
jgi:hypothetical protein